MLLHNLANGIRKRGDRSGQYRYAVVFGPRATRIPIRGVDRVVAPREGRPRKRRGGYRETPIQRKKSAVFGDHGSQVSPPAFIPRETWPAFTDRDSDGMTVHECISKERFMQLETFFPTATFAPLSRAVTTAPVGGLQLATVGRITPLCSWRQQPLRSERSRVLRRRTALA